MHEPLFPVPTNEKKRLLALQRYDLVGRYAQSEYNFITKMAAQICNTPASLITLLDEKTQFVKSCFGYQLDSTPREISFCNYSILDATQVNIVPDLRLDDRYNTNPLVTGEPYAVFYAGAPLVTPEGYVLGTICVLGAESKMLSPEQIEALKALAQQTMTNMELRKKNKDLKTTKDKLQTVNKNLKEFVKMVSHDMKTPLANITMLSKGFRNNFSLDQHSGNYINLIEQSATELISFIEQMFEKSKKNKTQLVSEELVSTLSILKKVIQFVAPTNDIKINIKGKFPDLAVDKVKLQQVFQNLITNAIKYNDKPKVIIDISSSTDDKFYYFNIADNGMGIAEDDLEKIFKKEQILNKVDRFGNKGTGIGLASVKSIVHSFGGTISVVSTLKKGTSFKFSIPIHY
jgi:signal transduction histidine kinase